MFIQHLLAGNYIYFFGVIFSVTFSVCLHEYAHAITAYKMGDDTAARKGHLSLNPMIQMGPTSLIIMCLIGIAWGAVPVNPSILRRKKHGEAIVALAGPATNLLLCVLSGIVLGLMIKMNSRADVAMEILWIFCRLNGVLFLLNMLPVPPLDGYTIAEGFFPKMREFSPDTVRTVGFYAIIIIIATPVGGFIWNGGELLARIFAFSL